MRLDDLFGSNFVVVALRSEDRWGAIEELVERLARDGKILSDHKQAIAAAVRKRESGGSTAIGSGLAMPHASTELATEVTVAFGLSPEGIQFEAPDDRLVTLVVLFLTPAGDPQKHVSTLASLAKLLRGDDFLEHLTQHLKWNARQRAAGGGFR